MKRIDENLKIEDNILYVKGDLDFTAAAKLEKCIRNKKKRNRLRKIDFSDISSIDTAGVAFIDYVKDLKKTTGSGPEISAVPDNLQDTVDYFSSQALKKVRPPKAPNVFEVVGQRIFSTVSQFHSGALLLADIFFWSLIGIFSKKSRRKGSIIQQTVYIGIDALPLVLLLSFILGFILSLQSAAQLQQFGANIYVADLLTISLVREMGPMMTAIIVAGRSSSSIASEIATMSVTEELDALRVMSINPIRYIVVPKFLAITITMPILVTAAIAVGIVGGLIVAMSYLGLSASIFLSRSIDVLRVTDIIITYIKSIFFAWVIVILGSYYGFHVTGGAEGVGVATTKAVVASIFAVIILDAVFSLTYIL
ncbi:MAG: ABC transporter permease [Spirochaetia bacterium]